MSDRILLLSSYSKNNLEVFELTHKNHQAYAEKWCLDTLNVQEPYNPHNNFKELKLLLQIYKTVISVGADILFTKFNKDIREFNDEKYPVVIQEESKGATVNGDFIFFNKALLPVIDEFNSEDAKRNTTQTYLNRIRNTGKVFVHPIRTIQSLSPFDDRKQFREAAWQPGDFSMHAVKPGFHADLGWKVDHLGRFISAYACYCGFPESAASAASSS